MTHGRPDNVKTFGTLRRLGYTGKIFLILDNEDKKQQEYIDTFGIDNVIVFDKKAVSDTFDEGDNFQDRRAIVYARNTSFAIAQKLGIEYFLQLDDDYQKFDWRFNNNLEYCAHVARNLDDIFNAVLKFYINTPRIASIAFAQGGDFIGGSENQYAQTIKLTRKCMNSFFCSIHRPITWVGTFNEDVTAYTKLASLGLLLFTTNFVLLTQAQTQSLTGGMTEVYQLYGTYVKSFYSIMFHPSSIKVKILSTINKRLHHSIEWTNTIPKILSEQYKKDR